MLESESKLKMRKVYTLYTTKFFPPLLTAIHSYPQKTCGVFVHKIRFLHKK